jgi:uncharacterized membrane protein YbaN (DUF454 family)
MKKMVIKSVFIFLGVLCVVLAFLGIFLPVLPTTPFLLLAAFFFARSSDRFLHWLLHNRWFGPYIRNYREKRGMTLPHKVFTLAMLWLFLLLTAIFAIEQWWLRLLLLVIGTGVTIHITSINTYRPALDKNQQSAQEPS